MSWTDPVPILLGKVVYWHYCNIIFLYHSWTIKSFRKKSVREELLDFDVTIPPEITSCKEIVQYLTQRANDIKTTEAVEVTLDKYYPYDWNRFHDTSAAAIMVDCNIVTLLLRYIAAKLRNNDDFSEHFRRLQHRASDENRPYASAFNFLRSIEPPNLTYDDRCMEEIRNSIYNPRNYPEDVVERKEMWTAMHVALENMVTAECEHNWPSSVLWAVHDGQETIKELIETEITPDKLCNAIIDLYRERNEIDSFYISLKVKMLFLRRALMESTISDFSSKYEGDEELVRNLNIIRRQRNWTIHHDSAHRFPGNILIAINAYKIILGNFPMRDCYLLTDGDAKRDSLWDIIEWHAVWILASKRYEHRLKPRQLHLVKINKKYVKWQRDLLQDLKTCCEDVEKGHKTPTKSKRKSSSLSIKRSR